MPMEPSASSAFDFAKLIDDGYVEIEASSQMPSVILSVYKSTFYGLMCSPSIRTTIGQGSTLRTFSTSPLMTSITSDTI